MNSLYYYFSYLWSSSDIKNIEETQILPKKFIITSDDLIKVNLNPQKDVVPAPK